MLTQAPISVNLSSSPKTRSLTRFIPPTARILMGLPLFVGGLNFFLPFLPQPEAALPPNALVFVGALVNSGYMLPLIFATQLVVGTLFLANRFVPLALVLFAPFILNSILFHTCLEHTGLTMSAIFLAFEIYLMWVYRKAYAPLFTPRSN